MKQKLLFMMSLALLGLLAACGGQAPTAIPVEDVGPVDGAEAQPTTAAAPATAPSEAVAADDPSLVREGDWTKGSDDPDVTIIEYGDFQ